MNAVRAYGGSGRPDRGDPGTGRVPGGGGGCWRHELRRHRREHDYGRGGGSPEPSRWRVGGDRPGSRRVSGGSAEIPVWRPEAARLLHGEVMRASSEWADPEAVRRRLKRALGEGGLRWVSPADAGRTIPPRVSRAWGAGRARRGEGKPCSGMWSPPLPEPHPGTRESRLPARESRR